MNSSETSNNNNNNVVLITERELTRRNESLARENRVLREKLVHLEEVGVFFFSLLLVDLSIKTRSNNRCIFFFFFQAEKTRRERDEPNERNV